LKSAILGAFLKSTSEHLNVDREVIILWAFSMSQRLCVELCFAFQSFISFDWEIFKEMQKIRTNSVDQPLQSFHLSFE